MRTKAVELNVPFPEKKHRHHLSNYFIEIKLGSLVMCYVCEEKMIWKAVKLKDKLIPSLHTAYVVIVISENFIMAYGMTIYANGKQMEWRDEV